MDCQLRNMKHTMQGLLLVLFVKYFSYVSGTLLLSGQQIPLQVPLGESDRGHIRLGRICENSLECRSGCCLYNSTAGFFTCQRENQRYSNCSPRRPKALWGTFLDVYLHHCPCNPHLRCVKEHTWHVCLKRKPPSGTPKPPGQKPIDEEKAPGGQKPIPPPGWHPGIGTYNGTLGLGQVCGTSIDCKSECCVYNPRVGFAYCHRLEQIYDDCSPWHPKEEKGTVVDIYFRHCPCNSHLRCRKEKKWHVCRKREPEFGTDRPSQQKPVLKPPVQRPQLEAQKPLQQRPVEVTAVGEPETHEAKPEYIPSKEEREQQQQIQMSQSDTQKPLQQRPVEVTAVGEPETHEAKPEYKPPKQQLVQQQQIQMPQSDTLKPLQQRPGQAPVVGKPEGPEGKPYNKTKPPSQQGPVQQQQTQTPQGDAQKQLPQRRVQVPKVRKPEEDEEELDNKAQKPSHQVPVQQQQAQTPQGDAQKPLPRPAQVPVARKPEAPEVLRDNKTQKPLPQEPQQQSQIETPNSEEQNPLPRRPSETTESGEEQTHEQRKQPPRKKPSRRGKKRKQRVRRLKSGNKTSCNCSSKANNQDD